MALALMLVFEMAFNGDRYLSMLDKNTPELSLASKENTERLLQLFSIMIALSKNTGSYLSVESLYHEVLELELLI